MPARPINSQRPSIRFEGSAFVVLHQEVPRVLGLVGVQPLSEFVKYDADLWRKASAYKGLRKPAQFFVEE